MPLQIDTIGHVCNVIARQIRDRFKSLTIHFVVHHHGQRVEALGMAGQEILYHPAAETALHLLTNARHTDESSLIGMAVAHQNIFFGLAGRNSLLALCSMNTDQYDGLKEARRHAYHMAWHAIDTLLYHNELPPRSGTGQNVIVRRRNALEMTAANLQADVFAAVMSVLQGDREAILETGVLRGKNILLPMAAHRPEHYPFIIAAETTSLALKRLRQKPVSKKKYVDAALKVAREVGKTFDENSLKQWLAFSEPAQDMAWRGVGSKEILSAAINTSDNTYVRAIGYLVSEITHIEPASILQIRNNYSPYADDVFNEKIHEKAVDDIFEDIIAKGLRYSSGDAFIQMANEQNMRLLDGQVVGWCAAALQASGQAFDQALKEGQEPEGPARREFMGERDRTAWISLKELGQKIIGQQRDGERATLEDVRNMSGNGAGLARLKKSVDMTLNDPACQQSQNLIIKAAPRPRVPAPAIAPHLEHTVPAYAVPAPGGGGFSGRIASIMTRRQQQNSSADEQESSGDSQ